MKKAHLDYLKKAVNIAINLKDIADVADAIGSLRSYRPPIYGMIRRIAADKRFYSVTENTSFWRRYALASAHDFIESISEEEWISLESLERRLEHFLNTWYAANSKSLSDEKKAEIEKELQEKGWSKPVEDAPISETPPFISRFHNYFSDGRIRDCTGSSGKPGGDNEATALSENGDPNSEMRDESYSDMPAEISKYNTDTFKRGNGQASGEKNAHNEADIKFMRSIDPTLRRLAKMIGRNGDDISVEVRGKFQHSRRSDISGITVGNDLNSVLPSELALLGEPATESIFYRKFTQKRLQIFSSSSSSIEKSTDRRGAIFLCIDTSGSMQGDPIMMAQTLGLAIAIIAQREKRPVCVISYSDNLAFFFLRNLELQRGHLLRFLNLSLGVGNNETLLFDFLLRLFPNHKHYRRYNRYFKNADLLVVSDFGWSPIEASTASLIRDVHADGMRFYALGVHDMGLVRDPDKYGGDEGGFGATEFLKLCDHRFVYTGKAVEEVV